MEATTIPITSLSPSEAPPASRSIRAVVSLFWPYSSSTKQCALLLADPDFRLRNRKGQVRVRFTGASAAAVASGRIGIGDELVLELGGAQWASEQAHVATPGKSVDGELVYRGQLALGVTRKANGEQSDLRILVNESTPPPEQPAQSITNGNHATPARAVPSWMRSSVGGADTTPIYSSPAFVKRLRLSGDETSWDPFADVERELEDNTSPRKRQRISFGTKRWKYTDRTPSPEKEVPVATQMGLSAVVQDFGSTGDLAKEQQSQNVPDQLLQANLSSNNAEQMSAFPTMPPPPLPRLQLPVEQPFVGTQQKQSTAAESDGPSTPKLHPVPSSALPLPSPFPTEASQMPFGIQGPGPSTNNTSLDVLGGERDATREAAPRGQHVPDSEAMSAEELSPIAASRHGLLPADGSVSRHQLPTISPTASLASTAEIVRDDEPVNPARTLATENVQHNVSRDDDHDENAEYLSDTEEDEEMYYNHMRRRFPSVTESGRVRVDHQEEGYYDNSSQIHEDEVEETIDADAMGEEPESEESGDDEDEVDEEDEDEDNVTVEVQETPQTTAVNLDENQDAASANQQAIAPAGEAAKALSDARGEVRQENNETLKTPAGPPPGLFGFDGTANDTPFQPKSTPQSEKERVMKKTFSSLFGFRASPSPEIQRQPQVQSPTPAMPIGHLSRIAKERLEAAGVPVDEATEQSGPVQGQTAADVDAEGSQQDGHGLKSPPLTAAEAAETINNAVEEAVQATEETGDSLLAADVQDGSLLSAVRADETKEYQQDRSREVPVGTGSTQLDVEVQDVPEDSVPDGLPINQHLGQAIAPDSLEDLQQLRPGTIHKPSHVEVIDLGGSSDDEEMDDQPAEQSSTQPAEAGSGPGGQSGISNFQDSTPSAVAAQTQMPVFPPTQSTHRNVTQDSQGSAQQSDNLTTQTTVDRSEIATPVAEEFDTVMADTSQEDALWLNQGRQDGFFNDQIQNHEFEGAAMPQLIQQPTADPYHYFSFQSATSVATDNSENMPPTAIQSFAQEEQQVGPVHTDWPERLFQEEQLVSPQPNNDFQLDPALSVPETRDHHVVEVDQRLEVEKTPPHVTEPSEGPVCRPEQPQTIEQAPDTMEIDSIQTESFSQQAQPVESAETVSRMGLPPHEQASYPALPISPEESQHRLESQEFETQMPYHSLPNELPPTPRLTQGDSLTENEVHVVIEEPDEEHASPQPTGPTRMLRSQSTGEETLQTPVKKTPARRSPRKSRAETEDSDKPVDEDQPQHEHTEPATSPRRRRSVQQDVGKSVLTSAKATPVRRSARNAHAPAETVEGLLEQEEHTSEKSISQTSLRQPSLAPEQKTPARRSTRKLQAESQTSEQATKESEGAAAAIATPAKPTTRQSARKALSQTDDTESVAAESVKTSEVMEDTTAATSPLTASTRQSARKARQQSEEIVVAAPPTKARHPSRKSFTSQLGRVPEVISNWFSPRRSSRIEHEVEEPSSTIDETATLQREKSNGIVTSLAYFTPLSNIEEKLNRASQYQADNTVDVLAVVTDETKAPERAKGGPRDYFTIFRITDSSLSASDSVRAEVFRPWHATLPTAQVSDIVLLRAFAVKTRNRKPYLLSTDASAWCVWRYAEEDENAQHHKPVTRKRGASFSVTSGAREEMKGPPVEMGEEERERVVALRKWWIDAKGKDVDVTEENGHAAQRTTRTTRSQKL